MFTRRVYANMFSRVVYPEYGVPITRAARHTAGSPAEGENRKSCLRPRVAWNETAGTRHLQDANKSRSPNMVFSCQVTRQIPPSCCAQVHVQGTRAESMFMCAGHSLQASTELHGTRRMFRASVFLWRFHSHYLSSFFCRQILFTLLLHHIFP
jgi:hypothetical protein